MMLFCPQCGKEIKEPINFCPHCGYSINPAKEESSESQKGNNTSITNSTLKDNTIATGSENVAISGDHNTVNQTIGSQQPIPVPSYEPSEWGMFHFGKWLMLKLFGTLKHSLKGFTITVVALCIGTILPMAIVPRIDITLYSSPFMVLDIICFGIVAVFGGGTIVSAKRTECPRCHYKFSYFNVSKFLIGTRETESMEVHHYKNRYRCNNCGYKYEDESVVQIEKNNP
jgi:DNA-directed RNA polymerase subunit RPC12/RpoP